MAFWKIHPPSGTLVHITTVVGCTLKVGLEAKQLDIKGLRPELGAPLDQILASPSQYDPINYGRF